MNSKLFKGIILGVATSGAAIWWWNSKSGKETRENIQDSMEDFYDFLKPRIRRFKKISYKKFQQFLKNAAMEYADLKDLSIDKIGELIGKAQKFTA
jgi:gas vesicle protein